MTSYKVCHNKHGYYVKFLYFGWLYFGITIIDAIDGERHYFKTYAEACITAFQINGPVTQTGKALTLRT